MLCVNCKKNQATKTYERIRKGKPAVEYYCMACYAEKFLSALDTGVGISACPYCGTTAEEIKKRHSENTIHKGLLYDFCILYHKTLENTRFSMDSPDSRVPKTGILRAGEREKQGFYWTKLSIVCYDCGE